MTCLMDIVLTILTGGLWLVVRGIMWLLSNSGDKQREHERRMQREQQAHERRIAQERNRD